jgi:hypothetical protein
MTRQENDCLTLCTTAATRSAVPTRVVRICNGPKVELSRFKVSQTRHVRTRLIERGKSAHSGDGNGRPPTSRKAGLEVATILKAAGRRLARVARQMSKIGGWQGTSRAHEHAILCEMTRTSETKLPHVRVCVNQPSQVSGGS